MQPFQSLSSLHILDILTAKIFYQNVFLDIVFTKKSMGKNALIIWHFIGPHDPQNYGIQHIDSQHDKMLSVVIDK
jgi:hypothetical protein